ncbi:MAG: hypothetical protein KJO35_09980, partial [Gammaproteobacteria bacterium]|nr:hypothetical protein [Gammaproteobacteria bacterium]
MNALAKIAPYWTRQQKNKVITGPIGIDLALERMHLVQLTRDSDNSIAVNARASVAYPASRDEVFGSGSELTGLLRAALRSGSFSSRRAVVALPGGKFRTMSVAYQLKPGQSESKILKNLMQDRLDGDLADYVIDFIPVRARSRDADRVALVAASPREPVIEFLEAIRKAGLSVDALEIGPLSIRRLIGALPEMTPDDNVVVVNTGLTTTYVTVLAGRR